MSEIEAAAAPKFYERLKQPSKSPTRQPRESAAPERLRASDRARGPPKDLTDLELRRILPLSEVSEFTSLSEDSLKRNHGEKILRLGPRRLGMTLGNMLAIGEETA